VRKTSPASSIPDDLSVVLPSSGTSAAGSKSIVVNARESRLDNFNGEIGRPAICERQLPYARRGRTIRLVIQLISTRPKAKEMALIETEVASGESSLQEKSEDARAPINAE
jgi:hypothetical protein